eukprot:11053011-Alexandrium_andersonii.AAC.1
MLFRLSPPCVRQGLRVWLDPKLASDWNAVNLPDVRVIPACSIRVCVPCRLLEHHGVRQTARA